MKRFLLLMLSVLGISYLNAQTQTNFIIPLAKTIDFSTIPNGYDPQLLNLMPQPHPASGSELLKQQINNERLQKKLSVPLNKTNTTNGATTPILLKGFQANFSNSIPNDNHMAISNGGKVVSVVNSNIRIYDTAGTLLYTKGLSAFSNAIGTFTAISDPRVIYDQEADRFIILYFSGYFATTSTIIVGFSKTNDPTGAWNFYTVPGNPFNDTSWSDYPILTITKDELFFTFNLLKDGVVDWRTAFRQSIIWQVDKQKGYQGAPLVTKVWGDIKVNGKPLWNICPAQGGKDLQSGGVYFVSVRPSDLRNDSIFVTYVSNTIQSGNAQLTTKAYRQNRTYGLPPNVPMPNGNYLQTNDARVLSAVIENNVLHYVQNTIDTTFNTGAVYYGRIINPQSAAPIITGTIIRSDTMDYGYPSIAYMGGGATDNSVMITCSHSSQKVKPGTSVFYADRTGQISPQLRCKDGEGWINALADTNERWGDYTGIQRKYNEAGIAWLCGSYGDPSTGNYRTWISKVRTSDISFGIKSTPSSNTTTLLYPNPAINLVTVEFETTRKAAISADVYDMQGKLVAHVFDDAAKDGLNRFSFNTQNLSSGNYLLRITSSGTTIVSKQFVVK